MLYGPNVRWAGESTTPTPSICHQSGAYSEAPDSSKVWRKGAQTLSQHFVALSLSSPHFVAVGRSTIKMYGGAMAGTLSSLGMSAVPRSMCNAASTNDAGTPLVL
jgi:hypothetical protein